MRRPLWLPLAFAAVAWACSAGESSAEDKKDGKGVVVGLDGLSSRTPADWKEEATTSKMRAHQFKLPRARATRTTPSW